jgi:hypothetical protein
LKWFLKLALGAGLGAALLVQPAQAGTVAVLQGLDKTTARVATINAPLDQQVRYGNLLITARACVKHPPTETPESAAFLVIDELPPDAGPKSRPERIFSGWMFASSPALSALENPVYDVSVLDCKYDAAPEPSVEPKSGLRKSTK